MRVGEPPPPQSLSPLDKGGEEKFNLQKIARKKPFVRNTYGHLGIRLNSDVTSATLPLAIEGVKYVDGQANLESQNTPQHQHICIVLPLTPDVNADQRRRARPCDASAARLTASACHADLWGSVPTLRPVPDGTSNIQCKENTKERRVRGSEGVDVDAQRGGRYGRAQEVKGKGKYRAETTPLILPKRRPAESVEAGATNSWIKRTGRWREVIL